MEETGASKRTRYLALRGRLRTALCEMVDEANRRMAESILARLGE